METATVINAAGDQRRELVELQVSDLVLDPVINRTVDPKWVERLAEQFNPLALGLFTCWSDNGTVKVIDGQHRKLAAGRDRPRGEGAVLRVSRAGGANSQRNVSAIDKFRKAVQAQHPDEVAVSRVLAAYGLQVGTGQDDVSAPMVLLGVYRRGGEEKLRQYIDLLLEAYPGMPRGQALHGELLSALLKVEKTYGRFKEEIDWDRVRDALASLSMIEFFTLRDLAHREGPQKTKAWHTAGQIVKLYNDGRRSGHRLKMWSEVAG